jgi:L-ascorbate metabolism protein UlaG (beta-lactamase superfamily)
LAISPTPLNPLFPSPDDLRDDIAVWWLGQAGFAMRSDNDLLFIDPYLSDVLSAKYQGSVFPHQRLHDSPVDPSEVTGLSTVMCTHGHTDHMDLGSLPDLQKKSNPVFVIPRSETHKGVERGINPARLVGLASGESFTTEAGVKITGVPAAHEEIRRDKFNQDLFMGYVVELQGIRFYHSGDCIPYENQVEILKALKPDVAFLPVNGRDSFRAENGVPGNFSFDEAVELCRRTGIKNLVCHHWGLFEFNTVEEEDLIRAMKKIDDVNCFLPKLGVPFGLKGLIGRKK